MEWTPLEFTVTPSVKVPWVLENTSNLIFESWNPSREVIFKIWLNLANFK